MAIGKKPPDDDEEEIPTTNEEEIDIGASEQSNSEEDDLLKLLAGEIDAKETKEEEPVEEGPIDTDEKFITPDLIELPPKWFYKIVRDKNLPKGLRLTDKMVTILDKIYFEGIGKTDLIGNFRLPSSTINMSIRRVRELWKMYKAGTLPLDENQQESGGSASDSIFGGRRSSGKGIDINSRTMSMSLKTTTFLEVDKTVADFLGPQVRRSMQFQDVMARIGLVTTYAMMQLGFVDRSKFVTLAQAVTENPENLYKYVASGLDVLINVVDADKLKKFTHELLALREQNRALILKIEELQDKIDKYENWLYEGGILLSRALDLVPRNRRFELAKWYLRYQTIMGGGMIATGEQGEGEEA